MDRKEDRHKAKRTFLSGFEKRKRAKEKQQKLANALSRTPNLKNYLNVLPQISSEKSLQDNQRQVPVEASASLNKSHLLPDEDKEKVTGEASTSTNDLHLLGSKENLVPRQDNLTDIGLWPEDARRGLVDYWIQKGNKDLQNCDQDILSTKSFEQIDGPHVRKCQTAMFARQIRNGEVVKRSWLCFSPSQGRLYCFICKLMSNARTQFTHGGFCDWKHVGQRLQCHESSKSHLDAVLDFAKRSNVIGCVNVALVEQARVISVVTFLSEHGLLAFRGDTENLGSPNNGNYLGLLELLSEYDDFLKKHITETANCGSGHVNYLSSSICNEIIEGMGRKVYDEIISRIKNSHYYSISMDSTSDEGHIDQLTVVFRYIEGCTPVERFILFLPNQGHKAKDMYDGLKDVLDANNLDIKNCRGQSYDNASAMSGKYNGLQALVKSDNELADWIPCAAHSLNLVGKNAAECCVAAIHFFNYLEELYVFFTSSTSRYQKLTEQLQKSHINVPTRISTTRWSCRADATRALVLGYSEIKHTLLLMSEDGEQYSKTRVECQGLHNKMCKLEIGIYAVFWNDILNKVNATNKLLQNSKLDLNTAVAALKSLRVFIEKERDNFSYYEESGKEKAGTSEYEISRIRHRNVRLTPLDYGHAPEVDLSPSRKFYVENYLPVIDQFLTSMDHRLSAYELVSTRFGFLARLEQLESDQIIEQARLLTKIYKDDVDENLGVELVQFAEFYKQFAAEKDQYFSREHLMYTLIIEIKVQDAFPNVETILKMYLVLMITNCTAERSFSKLKLVKNRLRTAMTQQRLNDLALLSSNSDILRTLKFDDLIDDFATRKARKVPL